MQNQRTKEWLKTFNNDYFDRQFTTPYRSTVKFCDWLEEINVLNSQNTTKILDIGTGKGANMCYMKSRFPNLEMLGLDINQEFIDEGNIYMERNSIEKCRLEYGDIFQLDSKKFGNVYEGIISYQTLSWLPNHELALEKMVELNPNWISFSSLFYEGLVDCKIEVKELLDSDGENIKNTSFYNIYSLPRIQKFFEKRGYEICKYVPFHIDIDLEKPKHTHMQTYTEMLPNGKRLQLSGPLIMNWYFVFVQKK